MQKLQINRIEQQQLIVLNTQKFWSSVEQQQIRKFHLRFKDLFLKPINPIVKNIAIFPMTSNKSSTNNPS